MNVLSLFDGISCGKVALDRAYVKYSKYYSSEIDKYASGVSQYNYPDIVKLGDIKNWKKWNLGNIDLILAGFPCQAWSLIGKQRGLKDDRGKIIFYMLDIFNELKSQNKNLHFLFENVKMKKENIDIINNLFGCEPVELNSALVSAQNRKRLYWTNIPFDKKIIDKNIYLKDIIEDNSVGVIKTNGFLKLKNDKSQCLDANYFKGVDNHGQRTMCLQVGEADLNGYDFLKRVYSIEYKSPTLTAVCGGNQERKITTDYKTWRKLTPVECERLQTLCDNYTLYGIIDNTVKKISNSQRYKMVGNGWTVDIISHILKGINTGGVTWT